MIYIKNNSTNPYFNHAAEEYVLKNFSDECFMLWSNIPCVLIGRNQNAYSEVNLEFLKKRNMPVVRRLSGGGTVFNDSGNLNFTFIANDSGNEFTNFKKFASPVMKALGSLGIETQFSSRNDITIDGKKISGNAQYKYENRILHHGTLLYSVDGNSMCQALSFDKIKYESRGVKSVSSRVSNISDYMSKKMSVHEFKNYLSEFIIDDLKCRTYEFSKNDLNEIKKISSKFSSWEWNYGKSPEYNFKNRKKFSSGVVQVMMIVQRGIINDIHIYGDFFSEKDKVQIENALKGCALDHDELKKTLNEFNFDEYMSGISADDFIGLMF